MDGVATPLNWGHPTAPAGTAGVINQRVRKWGLGGGTLGAKAGPLSWCPNPSRVRKPFRPLPPTPPCARYWLGWSASRSPTGFLSRGCSCSARSDGQDTRMDRQMRETRRLRSSAPCRLPGGTAAWAAPQYYPLFLGLHRDSESHPRSCLGGRMTKVTLSPPTRHRPLGAPGSAPAELELQPYPAPPPQLRGLRTVTTALYISRRPSRAP